jgi:hypothetical protein
MEHFAAQVAEKVAASVCACETQDKPALATA